VASFGIDHPAHPIRAAWRERRPSSSVRASKLCAFTILRTILALFEPERLRFEAIVFLRAELHSSLIITVQPVTLNERIQFGAEAEGVSAPFDHCGKCNPDWRPDGSRAGSRGDTIGILQYNRLSRTAGRLDIALFLLPCHRSFCCRANPRHPLRVLHDRGDGKSRRLAGSSSLDFRTSSFFWSTDGKGFHAKCKSNRKGHYVVCRRDVIGLCSNPVCVLGLASRHSAQRNIASHCAGMVGRNVVQQLEKQHGRLCEGPPCLSITGSSGKRSMLGPGEV
jgi:hypothetical protein